jgi:hypothetical protein
MEIVKKIEIDYFQDFYGNYFNAFNEVDVKPILRFEAHLLYHFTLMLRHRNVCQSVFFRCLHYIEQSISDVLFRKGSLFKFVFQDNKDNWFVLTQKQGKVYPCLVGEGPWVYH